MKITPGAPVPHPEKPPRETLKQSNLTISAKTAASALAASHAPQSHSAPRNAALLAALGLPADRLSASIVAFARFFSLPLEPALLAKIRRQAGQPPQPGNAPETRTVKQSGGGAAAPEFWADKTDETPAALLRNREALALAATAAVGKGVELSPKGLEDYASAIDPDQQGSQGQGNGRQDAGGQNRQQDAEKQEDRSGEINVILAAGSLRDKALEAAEQNTLLGLLNRLPGKNGRRWVVLPFNFTENGKHYRVSIRILIDESFAENRACQFNLEIARSTAGQGDQTDQRWLFAMDGGSNPRLEVLLWPDRPQRALNVLAPELAKCMGLPPERVSVGNCAESFPFTADSRNDVLRSINEQV